MKKDNFLLNQKLKYFCHKCILRFEKEEIEIKYEELEKEKIALEDKIEEDPFETPLRNYPRKTM